MMQKPSEVADFISVHWNPFKSEQQTRKKKLNELPV